MRKLRGTLQAVRLDSLVVDVPDRLFEVSDIFVPSKYIEILQHASLKRPQISPILVTQRG